MVVVAAIGEAGVDDLWYLPDLRRVASDGETFDVAVSVENERSAVAGPVGGFEAFRRGIDHSAIHGF